jgi:hypothetical protein
MSARQRPLSLAIALVLFASMLHARFAGRPLTEALRELQSQGLKLIYSDDVVRPEMRVAVEPRARTPRRILDELLHEHLLHAEAGPQGTLLIVRDERIVVPSRATAPPKPEMPVALAEIVVTPSRFTLLAGAPESRQFLDRDEVRRLPHLADDVYRAIARIPGTAGSDVSARFHLRGGAQDEVLVLVDGAEIYDPFHVKDLFRAFSTIDAEAVGSVDVLSGGYPVEYGGRMSGVVDISTLVPEGTRTEAGISILATRLLSQGKFGSDRGAWLLSVRRGYLRELLQLVDNSSKVNPRYYDILGKVEWALGSRGLVSAHLLATRDKLRLREDPNTDGHASYRDQYGWINLRGSVTPRLFGQSVLSVASLTRERDGHYDDLAGSEIGSLDERREARIVSWKNDASFDVSARTVLRAGFTAKSVRARYDYQGAAFITFSNFEIGAPSREVHRSSHLSPSGHELSAYIADRMRLSDRLVAEAGLRAASESYAPDGVHLDPRVQLAWAAASRTAVRLAWGVIHQSQRIDELPVEDGQTSFDEAQRAVHRVVSVEQQLPHGAQGRIELYDKSITQVRPRYENLYNGLLPFPELRPDRVRIAPDSSHARGAEVLVRSDSSKPVSAWISYSLASVTDEIEGRDVPRAWDQRHAAAFSLNVRRGKAWNFNLAGTWHSGWPTTPVVAHLESGHVVSRAGERSSERLPAYSRLDLRATRSFRHIDFFVELFNVLNRANVARVDSFSFTTSANGTVTTRPVTEAIVGVIPSFGVTYRF